MNIKYVLGQYSASFDAGQNWPIFVQKRSGLEDLENWDDTPQVCTGGFCTQSPISNLQVSRSWRDIMPKKRNIDVLPQASNDYRFANGFQGRMFNLKRSAGAPVLIPQASNNYRFANGFQGRMINLKRSGGAPLKIEMEDDEDIPLPAKIVSKRNPGCLRWTLKGKWLYRLVELMNVIYEHWLQI